MDEESVWSAATWGGHSDEDAAWATGSLGIPPGHLIVDSAAGQALIGEPACVRWEQKLSDTGLRGVRVHCKMMTPKGVGGAAHPTRSIIMPTMIDGLLGVLQYTVVEEDIPGLLPQFSRETGSDDQFAHEQAPSSSRFHASHTRGHLTMHVTTGLTPVTFRVPEDIPQQFGLTWHQFVTGTTVDNPIRDGKDQLVAEGETENMCPTVESIHEQHGKISKQTDHLTSPQGSITINHQDKIVGQDNDHLHLTDSHFFQDDQEWGHPSNFSHDAGPFPLSDAITGVDLTTWGPDVRRHNQGGRSMGSTTITAVVTTRGGVARASQVWQEGRYNRTFDVLAPYFSTTEGSESTCQVGKLLQMPAKTVDGEARQLEGGENLARESSGKGGDGQEDGRAEEQGLPIRSPTTSATSPGSHSRTHERSVEKRSTEQARVRSWTRITSPHGSSEQQHQRSPRGGAQGTGTTSRILATHVGAAVTDAAGSSARGVCSDIQQLAETQQVATAWTSEETRRKTS